MIRNNSTAPQINSKLSKKTQRNQEWTQTASNVVQSIQHRPTSTQEQINRLYWFNQVSFGLDTSKSYAKSPNKWYQSLTLVAGMW